MHLVCHLRNVCQPQSHEDSVFFLQLYTFNFYITIKQNEILKTIPSNGMHIETNEPKPLSGFAV